MLFGQDIHNIVTLNQDEMRNTEGEWLHIFIHLAIWGAVWANTPTNENDIRTGRPIPKRPWRQIGWD